MYNGFFGFKEKPFKLIPNPDFLFMGKTHEEALAHLIYATSHGNGFVEITGEVGTGKTTLCRVFLEDLSPDIEAAYIFNSKIDSIQLLKLIHTELGIAFISNDPVDLTNTLNRYLLEKKSNGKSVILIIDEAQHLGSETLEQLRLLSNLETTKSKLLQIILVGQPELGQILDSFEMRQLRQRISLSCQILPLTLTETCEYINHRINVALKKQRELFSGNAKKNIYQYSKGIPRRINIICDRALLVAYSLGKKNVSASIIKKAIKELEPPRVKSPLLKKQIQKSFTALFFLLFVAGVLFFITQFISLKETSDRPVQKVMGKKVISKKIIPTPAKQKPAPLLLEELIPPGQILLPEKKNKTSLPTLSTGNLRGATR